MSALVLLFVLFLAPEPGSSPGPLQGDETEETIISAADIPAWVRTRFVTVRAPRFSTGSLDSLFDREPATSAAFEEAGATALELFFRKPVTVHQLSITPCRGAAYRWDAACAAKPEPDGRFVYQPLVAARSVGGGDRDPV